MARLNITLDQDEVLQLLKEDTSEAFRTLLQEALNAVLRRESDEMIGVGSYERGEARRDLRNGTRARGLTTRIGQIELTVPRHRGEPFRTQVFSNFTRSEAALVTTMAEMVVGGMSTAKVGAVMDTLCGRSFSKQSVSAACRELDSLVRRFARRPIEGEHPFVMADATYVKARENGRVVSKALMIAMAFTPAGRKEVLGFAVRDREDQAGWTEFLSSVRDRGLKGVRMFTSDAHPGLVAAAREVFPDAPWQRCQAHFSRNVLDGAPKRMRAGLRLELAEMFNCETLKAARARRDEIIADYSKLAPQATERLDAGFDDAMTVMELPAQMRRCVRTSNYLERLNREVKRRSRAIGVFPNAGSVIRLAGALLMEENERWAAVNKAYYGPAVAELAGKEGVLRELAQRQTQMLLAK